MKCRAALRGHLTVRAQPPVAASKKTDVISLAGMVFSTRLMLAWIESLESIVVARMAKDEADVLLDAAVVSAREAVLRSMEEPERQLFLAWLQSRQIPSSLKGAGLRKRAI